MSDDRERMRRDDELSPLADVEALLAELGVDDLQLEEPPAEVWAGIERRIAAERPSSVVALAQRRRGFFAWGAAAAAAMVAVVLGTVLLTSGDDDGDVVSAATLAYDPASFDPRGATAAARAQVVERAGELVIRLTDARLPRLDADDDLELWLIEPDATGKPVDVAPVALLDPEGDGTYKIPAGLDPGRHYVVDISIEPRDGNPTHSGQSILRGPLQPQ